jgi:ABC-type lipoprotein release transport system permease subunit
MLLLRLAWRNIFRNKRRTIIAATAIGIGLASLIFTDGLIIGMEETMVRNLTASFLGEGQIHAEGFRQTGAAENTIHGLKGLTERLERDSRISCFAVRAISPGMLSSTADYRPVEVVGVEPDRERLISQVAGTIYRGNFFSGGSPRDIVIGAKLADDLDVSIGDRVVLTVAQAGTGALAQDLFLVSGIYRFNSRDLDNGMALIRLPKAQELLGIGQRVHEVALDFRDPGLARNTNNVFWRQYSQGGNEALGWPALMPQVDLAFRYSELSMYVLGLILFGVVAFGIINTLFMSIYERIFEIGVLRALGTRALRVALMIVLEAGLLATVSIAAGSILGLVVIATFARVGIDYRGIEMMGVTIRNLIHPVLTGRQFWFYPFWVLVFTLVTSSYPASYAARIQPAEAMRKSL